MFTPCRKRGLVQKLLRKAVVIHQDQKEDEEEKEKERGSNLRQHDHNRQVTAKLLKKMKESQLETLYRAVESAGASETSANNNNTPNNKDAKVSHCVPMAPGLSFGKMRQPNLALLTCQLFRWPGIGETEIRPLPICAVKNKNASSGSQLEEFQCCNPYHWTRVYVPEVPEVSTEAIDRLMMNSRSKRALSKDQHLNVDYSSSLLISHSTNGSRQEGSSNEDERRREWCRVAYWEENQRVGQQFRVFSTTVDIFADQLPRGSGLCLQRVFQENKQASDRVVRTRDKIRQGLLLSTDEAYKQVWIYNRTNVPIFVSSPSLFNIITKTCPVFKVLPGYSVQVFDYEKSKLVERSLDCREVGGPIDLYSVQISFAKGWGDNYTRQDVISCPCWLQICIEPPPR